MFSLITGEQRNPLMLRIVLSFLQFVAGLTFCFSWLHPIQQQGLVHDQISAQMGFYQGRYLL